MASENKMKQMMSQSTPRQKAILVVMVLVVLIVVWQVKSLMGGGSVSPPPTPAKPTTAMSAAGPNASKSVAPSNTPGAATPPPGSSAAAAPAQQEPDQLKQVSVVNDPQFLKMQKTTEEKYVDKLNQLEELKIQRQIAETNQAITTAKLATVSAEKNISDLLTKPEPVAVAPSAYANQLIIPTQTGAPNMPGAEQAAQQAPPTPKAPPEIDYLLISVSMQLNHWNAVIGYQGQLYSVGVGDVLHPDGSVVTNINKNSVTLKKNDKTRVVNIVSSI